MDMQEEAWHLMLDSDLVEGGLADFNAAKHCFLRKYPGQELIWDAALEEYYENRDGC